MENNTSTEGIFDSTNLIVYMYKWRIPLLSITLVAAVLAAVFSAPFFIPPKYKSTVTVFPTTTSSVSKGVLPQQFSSRGQDILEFGEEDQAEQLLQLLHSDEIRNKIIKKFNLIDHYKIDSDGPYTKTELYETYSDNISFRRTEYMSVEINVLDTDPDTAARIANEINLLVDSTKNRIQKERAKMGLDIVAREYNSIKAHIKSMEEELTQLRYKGVHDYESQSSVLSEQLATALIEKHPDHPSVKAIERKLDTLAKYGGTYVSLRDELGFLKEEQIKLKSKYDQAKVDVEASLPATFTVNDAYPAEKKSYPTRWLIVALSAVGAFSVSFIMILIVDTVRRANKKQVV
tara:strand:- start:7876 stop:8916 length:1041 start_codon:yes stop_codon:yes gene_type:complete